MDQPDFVLHGLDEIAGIDTIQLHAAGASTLAFSVTGTEKAALAVHMRIMEATTSATLGGMPISIRGVRSTEKISGYWFDCDYDALPPV